MDRVRYVGGSLPGSSAAFGGLPCEYQEADSATLLDKLFAWSQTSGGNVYESSVVSKLNPGQWGAGYTYDGFGNLTDKTALWGYVPPLQAVYDPATNRPIGGNYDANGNAPIGSWTVENRLLSQTLNGAAVTWGYDGSGQRIMEYQVVNGQGQWTLFLYDIQGRRIGRLICGNSAASCVSGGTEVSFGSRLMVRGQIWNGNGQLINPGTAVVTDRLGGVRAAYTNGTWTTLSYFPFGEEKTPVTPDGAEKFGTYVRDSTLGSQDYAMQRYYSANLGRFDSPDRGGGANGADPTSWNRYSYVQGDPVNYTDTQGLYREGPGNPFPPIPIIISGPTAPDPTDSCNQNQIMAVGCRVAEPDPGGGGPANPCDRSVPLNAQALNWIAAHGTDAANAAAKIGVTEAFMLSLSAIESGWGAGPFVSGQDSSGNTVYYNNFFSQHAPAPNENGTVTLNGNYMATYADYSASAVGFTISNSGQLVANMTSSSDVAKKLQDAGYYGINPDGSKVPNFVSDVGSTSNFVAARLNCN